MAIPASVAGWNQGGTLDVLSQIEAQAGYQTVAQYGEDRLFQGVEESLAIHNALLVAQISEWVVVTNDRLRRYGGEVKRRMRRLDEYGASDVQKSMPPAVNVGFPLYEWGDALQWTRRFFMNATVADFIKEIRAIQIADINNTLYEIKKALYHPFNNLTYEDLNVDGVQLPLRALLNADGSPIPRNPYTGATFNPDTHTHYLYATSLTATAVQASIDTVTEHGTRGQVRTYISMSMENAMRALEGSGFVPYVDPRVTQPTSGTGSVYATTGTLNVFRPDNRPIGIFGASEVWVKHWVLPNYLLTFDSAPDRKVLAMRIRPGAPSANFGQLQLVYDNENFPLRANQYVREMGFGVNDRAAASITYIAGGASAFQEPSIPLP
jgi:hypothetical protein